MPHYTGLFGEEDDWMTGSVESKGSAAKPSKKPSSGGQGALLGGLGGEEEEEGGESLFAEPTAKEPVSAEPKKKVK